MRTNFRRPWAFAAGLAGALIVHAHPALAASSCKIELLGQLKVEPGSGSPRLKGEVEGHPVSIVADTGAAETLLLEPTARRLGLPLDEARGFQSYGAGGMTRTYSTPPLNVNIGGARARIPLLVTSGGVKVDMLVGDDFFNQADVEFDLAHDVIRLIRMRGCSDDETPYWAKGPYSVAPLTGSTGEISQYVTHVRLNGREVSAVIDSGADMTVISLDAARSLGLQITATKEKSQGLGEGLMAVSTVGVDSFAVGDEAIRNVHLSVADLHRGVSMTEGGSRVSQRPADLYGMLLGADFIRSHRIILSHARAKAYFTYSGGPVFSSGDEASRKSKVAVPGPPAEAAKPGD